MFLGSPVRAISISFKYLMGETWTWLSCNRIYYSVSKLQLFEELLSNSTHWGSGPLGSVVALALTLPGVATFQRPCLSHFTGEAGPFWKLRKTHASQSQIDPWVKGAI